MSDQRLLLRLVPAIAVLISCAACTSSGGSDGAAAVQPANLQTVTTRNQAAVLLMNRCPLSDPAPQVAATAVPLLSAAAAALVPLAADFAISAVRDYLARLQSERTGNYLATGQGSLQEGAATPCLIIVRGAIGSNDGSSLAPQASLTADIMRSVGLTAPPDFYMEARLAISRRTPARGAPATAQAITDIMLRPQVVQFARTVAARGQSEPKTVGIVLVMRATPAPAGADAAAAANAADAVIAWNLGAIRPGQEIRPAVFPPRGGVDEASPAHPLANLVRSTAVQGSTQNLNLYAFVTETGEPDRVLQLVIDAFGRKSAGLETALTAALQDAVKRALAPPARN